jgi:hypothetical protein
MRSPCTVSGSSCLWSMASKRQRAPPNGDDPADVIRESRAAAAGFPSSVFLSEDENWNPCSPAGERAAGPSAPWCRFRDTCGDAGKSPLPRCRTCCRVVARADSSLATTSSSDICNRGGQRARRTGGDGAWAARAGTGGAWAGGAWTGGAGTGGAGTGGAWAGGAGTGGAWAGRAGTGGDGIAGTRTRGAWIGIAGTGRARTGGSGGGAGALGGVGGGGRGASSDSNPNGDRRFE